MPYIQLSGKRGHGHRTLVDEDTFKRYGNLSWFLGDTGYAMRRSDMLDDGTKVTVRLHRLIMNAPEGMVVDHLNGDKLDNRRSNLRLCSQLENAKNRHGTTGFTWDASKGKYTVRYRGKFYGRYSTEEGAARAYQLARSGVPYEASPKVHARRKYLPSGVLYMKSYSSKGKPFYIRPTVNGIRHFKGYFATVDEAQQALKSLLSELREEK